MTLTQTHHFCVRKFYCQITLICPIILISHIVQLLLIRKFYCFCKGPHISFKYMWHIIYVARWWEKYRSKRNPFKHTCPWRDKLNRKPKIVLHMTNNNVLSEIWNMFLIWHVQAGASRIIYLSHPCLGTSCPKQGQYLKVKWLQQDSNRQPLSL